ncbi:MAG: hypothetical protein GXC94_13155 [Comamonadaceae bacterium]|nr:hypothetical protein [Comamonadaceae bacterium]
MNKTSSIPRKNEFTVALANAKATADALKVEFLLAEQNCQKTEEWFGQGNPSSVMTALQQDVKALKKKIAAAHDAQETSETQDPPDGQDFNAVSHRALAEAICCLSEAESQLGSAVQSKWQAVEKSREVREAARRKLLAANALAQALEAAAQSAEKARLAETMQQMRARPLRKLDVKLARATSLSLES